VIGLVKLNFFLSTADWLLTCSAKDPDFPTCNAKTLQDFFGNIHKGNYKLEGLDSIDPLFFDKINILENGRGSVNLNANLYNIKITGFSNVNVTESKIRTKDNSWITTAYLPKLRLEGKYQMNGQILVIPINVS
jgi:hypothetical protein